MNCECIFVLKDDRNNMDAYNRLAETVNSLGCDLESWYISRITTTTKIYNASDSAIWPGQQKRVVTTLNAGDLVLFVGGKYHYMFKRELYSCITANQKRALRDCIIGFPSNNAADFFEDITQI